LLIVYKVRPEELIPAKHDPVGEKVAPETIPAAMDVWASVQLILRVNNVANPPFVAAIQLVEEEAKIPPGILVPYGWPCGFDKPHALDTEYEVIWLVS